MDLPILFTGVAGSLVFICWYLARWIRQIRAVPKPIVFADPASCKKILACQGYNIPGEKNLYTDVESRAIPNKRLILAFEIDNSFTTSDGERRREFNSEAVKAIRMTEAKWQKVAESAKNLIRQAVSPSDVTAVDQPVSITLDSLVRSVCLKVVIHVLFDHEPLDMDNESTLTITESINSLWILSKDNKVPSEAEKLTLKEALAVLLPDMKLLETERVDNRENPLNLIIPAYETLWRVVLSGFLQVTFVKGASATWRLVLAQFLANPTIAARKEPAHDSEAPAVSVDHVVKEALRLYPSVKRVYRKLNMKGGPGPQDVAANIEACQRNEALWGESAQRFVPSRWIDASNEAQHSYMAFGFHFVCPAKNEFGPMMIGILVAAFAHHISAKDWHLELGEHTSEIAQSNFDRALRGEEPLRSDRSTYEGISIIRK